MPNPPETGCAPSEEGSGGPPLFEVLFLLQPQGAEVAAPDAEIAAFPVVGTQAQDFALVLDLVEAGGGLIGTFSHNQALFDSTTALRWRGHLEALLAGVAADPTRPLTELPLLSEGERHQVTFEWVRGHVGIAGNERADRLSQRGAQEASAQVIDFSKFRYA